VQKTAPVGNYYCQQFTDAWAVAQKAAQQLPSLEERSRRFAATVESSTLPPAALDAALSNLSTLRTNTAFRTADGEFHGFEGCNNQSGCCHGNCTHVWNYEQTTAFRRWRIPSENPNFCATRAKMALWVSALICPTE
jgi:uncharacterized protein (DUF608 family)